MKCYPPAPQGSSRTGAPGTWVKRPAEVLGRGLAVVNIAVIGFGLVVAGVATLMAQTPSAGDYSDREDVEERKK